MKIMYHDYFHTKMKNINLKHRVTIPCKWSFDFMKSTQNLIKANVSTKTIQFDECRRGAMNQDFMKSWVIAPSLQPPN